jgi:chemotaxis protein CheZ
MPAQRKVFRIEQMGLVAKPAAGADPPASPPRPHDVLAEIKALRDLIERQLAGGAGLAQRQAAASGPVQLNGGTERIQRAISHTRQEIAALRRGVFEDSSRVARELAAVFDGAERATEQILAAAEVIEEAADTLSASLQREQEQGLAQDIQDHAVRIFEACNFQDLAGQRIAKVIAALTSVEAGLARMTDIWGGLAAFEDDAAAAATGGHPAEHLHGPKIEGDPGHVTQAEVDALFATR